VSRGIVYLVGAGPGDPGLLTVKGMQVLGKAEVVVYDYLANEEFLDHAPPEARRIYVGKKGGDHTMSQEDINRLLVDEGREHRVVRLKGGDPFVFGRGGEEAQALAAEGVSFEIVPGVTAAVAVPAYAGIPLSHRDYAAAMTFITGHEREDGEESTLAWDKLAAAPGTLVFFMGVKNLPRIARSLVDHGQSPQTPVAVVRWGTTPRQRTVAGTLETIADRVREAGLRPPAIIVVGGVVDLRKELSWFESRPLFGRSIVVTRAREQASDFKALLEERGARCVEFPTISIEPPPSWGPLDEAVARLSTYQWAVFTSVNGVRFFMERLHHAGTDVRELKGVRLAAIGPKTAEALESRGLRLDLVPGEYRAEAILQALEGRDLQGVRFLMPRAMEAREVLPETLEKRGAVVDVVPAYRTVLPRAEAPAMLESFRRKEIHCVTFTSSSTVSNFFSLFDREEILELLQGVLVACIGPVTGETARKHGLEVRVMAEEYTIAGLVRALEDHWARSKK